MRYVILIALVLLAGCATSPTPLNEAIAVPSDRIYLHGDQAANKSVPVRITRDTGLNGRGCPVTVSVDGQKTLGIKTGETVVVYLSPGSHIFGATSPGFMCGMGPVENQIDIRGPTKVRVSIGRGSRLAIGPTTY